MNPEVDFRCKNGSINILTHDTYPWSRRSANAIVLIGDGVMCRKDFYDYIYDQIPPVLPFLVNDYAYSLKQMFLPWIWETFSRGNCVMAGHCFRHMRVERDLPFTPRDFPSDFSGTRHYFYTGPESVSFDFDHQHHLSKEA